MSGPIEHFGRNHIGRDLIVGDVHGHFVELQRELDRLGFDPEVDRLFSVGDLVDRGPESESVLEWLAKPWFHAVRGNHEQMLISWEAGDEPRDLYFMNGGGWAIATPKTSLVDYALAFASLPIAIELETAEGLIGVVHAECPTHTWAEVVESLVGAGERERRYMTEACLWGRTRFELAVAAQMAHPVRDVRAVVNGHTPVNGVQHLANNVFIDTGAGLNRERHPWARLTVIDAATLQPAVPAKETA